MLRGLEVKPSFLPLSSLIVIQLRHLLVKFIVVSQFARLTLTSNRESAYILTMAKRRSRHQVNLLSSGWPCPHKSYYVVGLWVFACLAVTLSFILASSFSFPEQKGTLLASLLSLSNRVCHLLPGVAAIFPLCPHPPSPKPPQPPLLFSWCFLCEPRARRAGGREVRAQHTEAPAWFLQPSCSCSGLDLHRFEFPACLLISRRACSLNQKYQL